jgi:hypothetical protein
MKSGSVAAIAFLGAGLAATSSFAATPVPRATEGIIGSGQFPEFVQVASKSEKAGSRKKQKRYDDDFSYQELGIIPGHVPTPYGYRDCIGRWHLHDNGIIHCHGQLIRDY